MKVRVAVLSAMLCGAGFTLQPMSASADTSLAHLTGSVDASSGTVVLSVEQPTAYGADGLPDTITDTQVATSTVASDGSFTVNLPDTTTVRAAAQNGWVDTVTTIANGSQYTVEHDSVLVDPSNDAAASTDEAVPLGSTIDMGAAPAMTTMSSNVQKAMTPAAGTVVPMDTTHCSWTRTSTTEPTNRIGELHVANVSGAKGVFAYHTQADSHFEVGLSIGSGSYKASGTHTVSNSIAASGSYTQGAGKVSYANTHMYWGRYVGNGATTCPGTQHKVYALSSAGDVFTGANTPGFSPWGTCHGDPHGYGTVNANGLWSLDRATGHEYSTVSDTLGFSAGGHTGYTSGIHVNIYAGGTRTYVCGDRAVPNMSIVYNKKS